MAAALAAAVQWPFGQCPASCRPGSGQGCLPPRCGPKCCSYWSRRRNDAIGRSEQINVSLPEWVHSCPVEAERVRGCASLWPAKPNGPFTVASTGEAYPGEPPVVLVSLFKDVLVADLLRFLEYHLLLGVDHAVLVDNSCGHFASDAVTALKPYVTAGYVTHNTQFVCSELRSMMFMQNFRGGSSMARQLSTKLRSVPKDAFIVPLDDDEYLTLADHTMTLRDLRRELIRNQVCAVTVTWRVYGSNGHRCQPRGPLMRNFVRRALTESEAEAAKNGARMSARREAKLRHLNTPFGGKPVYVFRTSMIPMCGTHWCDACPLGLTNCALSEQGAGLKCERQLNLTRDRFWINHYAFQSQAHWELKKVRGRTNQLPSRTGGVPRSYDKKPDTLALQLLQRRIQALAQPTLRRCLATLFGGGDAVGRPRNLTEVAKMKDSPTPLDPDWDVVK